MTTRSSQKSNSVPQDTVNKLLSAALAIPIISTHYSESIAQTAPTHDTESRVQYSWYRDYQGANDGRMRIHAPSLWVRAPVGSYGELESNVVVDDMTGASTMYLDTLSGASRLGIKDTRYGGNIHYTHYLERFSIGGGLVGSTEDDYDSIGGTIESNVWTEDRNTTISFGLSGNNDSIGSTNNESLHEDRHTLSYLIGVTQILSPHSQLQSNITFSSADGYLTDQYKFFDNRPRSRDAVAWLTRYAYKVLSTGGVIHADYRLFLDSWGIDSHTLELLYRHPLSNEWFIEPLVRYYSQGRADFFRNEYPPTTEGFYSADQRVSQFGGISVGARIGTSLGNGYSADLGYEHIYQDGGLKLGGNGTKGLAGFGADLITIGLNKKF